MYGDPDDAQMFERSGPGVPDPVESPGYVVQPQPVASGHPGVDPDGIIGSHQHRSPT